MSLEQRLDEIELCNRNLYSFDLGTCSVEEIIFPYYKQYRRDKGEEV